MRRVKRSLAVLSAVAIMSLTVSGIANAITWGQSDGDGHPHVVQILFVQDGVGFFGCSGTLLTSTVVLTAGHCTGWVDDDGLLQPNDGKTYVANDPDIAQKIADTLGDYDSVLEWLEGEWVSGDAVPHPEYADFAGFPDTFDIGVVLLDDPIVVAEYGAMPSLGEFDHLRTRKMAPSNRMVELVGYGLVGTIPAFADDDIWDRRVGFSTIVNTGASALVGEQNFQFTNNPGKGNGVGGGCFGDSGGPAFWVDPATGEPTNVIVAVTSFGITGHCGGVDHNFRTDTAVALDFVNDFLP